MRIKGCYDHIVSDLIVLLTNKPMSSNEIMSMFGLSRSQQDTVIHNLKQIAEVQTTYRKERSRRASCYQVIGLRKARKEQPHKEYKADMSVLPTEIRREKLIDWHLANPNPMIKTVKDLYQMARRNNIRVYTQGTYGRRWIV